MLGKVIEHYLRLITICLLVIPSVGYAELCPPSSPSNGGDGDAVSSSDPNQLIGPAGYGDKHYVPLNTLLAYRIDFENDPSATAPAQQVDITNSLEENLDWSSFEITEIGFGDTFIAVPQGLQQYEVAVPMTYQDITIEVQIKAGIYEETGEVYAHFYSIDPATGWPPPVEIGFLPPEDGFGRGMGHISYVINHKEDIKENTEIRNIAKIVFDLGEEIYTNQVDPHDPSQGTDPEKEALVSIDAAPPESSIKSVELLDSGYLVIWAGIDSGSDVGSYNIYVRDTNQLTWELWLENTTETQAEFNGTPGHSYEFYSVSVDNVGFREKKNSIPEIKFTIPGPLDLDLDGIADSDDNCPTHANQDQLDTDTDGEGDVCDEDDDNDGVEDVDDNCLTIENADQTDTDADGVGDVCDSDDDNDSVADINDNCPQTSNSDQLDSDGDLLGDACDICAYDPRNDIDEDSICGNQDNCPEIENSEQEDFDNDGLGDPCDPQTCGNGSVEDPEKCDDGNINNGDGCSSTCAPELDVIIEKALFAGKSGVTILEGQVRLPLGITQQNVAPMGAITLGIAEQYFLVNDEFRFQTRGSLSKIWKYKGQDLSMEGIHRISLLWHSGRFVYDGRIFLEATFLAHQTHLTIDRKDIVGEFSLQIGSLNLQVSSENSVTISGQKTQHRHRQPRGNLDIRLPFDLMQEDEIVLMQPGQNDESISIQGNLSDTVGVFRVHAKIDRDKARVLPVQSKVTFELSLGARHYTGYAESLIRNKEKRHRNKH